MNGPKQLQSSLATAIGPVALVDRYNSGTTAAADNGLPDELHVFRPAFVLILEPIKYCFLDESALNTNVKPISLNPFKYLDSQI